MNKMTIQKYRIGRSILFLLYALGAPASYALDMTFPDAYYCFDQFALRGNLANTTLDYTMVIPKEDQLKVGDVFVGFRLKSSPSVMWLESYTDSWSLYDGNGEPVAYLPNSPLPPVLQINIIGQPTDLTAYSGDGEVLVGYGRRVGPDATMRDSFQDMVANQHYSVIWEVGPQSMGSTRLCLNVTGLSYLTVTVGFPEDLPAELVQMNSQP